MTTLGLVVVLFLALALFVLVSVLAIGARS